MRILYVASRYRTNQVPIIKTLCEHHYEVIFFSQYAARNDENIAVVPEIIGYSVVFQLYNHIYQKLHRHSPVAVDMRLTYGFPPLFRMARRLKQVKPDVVIIRERSLYSIVTTLLCRRYHYRTILYNQSPLYGTFNDDLKHRIVNSLTPSVRMSPVYGVNHPGATRDLRAVFVPFVMEVQMTAAQKEYCKDSVLHIFAVGKYEPRKKLQMLIEAVEEIQKGIPVELTIAGEVESEENHLLFDGLTTYIAEKKLSNVKLLSNLNRKEMNEQYARSDLFVIPSTGEPASISQLEAMAFSVPCICSDTNGTACYIKSGYNGYLFKDCDQESLRENIERFTQNPEQIAILGRNAYDYLQKNCQYENYIAGIQECLRRVDNV